MKNTIITVYVTHSDEKAAEKVVFHLLHKKIIACANFFPIKSTYWWKGSLETNNEIVTLLKTKEENFEQVKQEILKIHPYETPCILKFSAEANEAYTSWVLGETNI
jgi:periplasmic divalent cation tolerance protein